MRRSLASPFTRLEEVAPSLRVPAIRLEPKPGESWAVMGRSGSGKSELLSDFVKRSDVTEYVPAKRTTPQQTATEISKRNATQTTEVLTALGLWDARKEPIHTLSPSQKDAYSWIPHLINPGKFIISDGKLDRLDCFTLENLFKRFAQMTAQGSVLLCSTSRAEIGERMSHLCLVHQGVICFAGTTDEFVRQLVPDEISIESPNPSLARMLVPQFQVDIQETETGLRLSTRDGLQDAAKLLTQGYGTVKAVVHKRATLHDALLAFFEANP